MDDKKLSLICLAIVALGLVLFAATYHEEFEKKTLTQMLNEDGTKGMVFGRIDYVINSFPSTQLILSDGNKALVFYPKESDLNKNDFVYVYAQTETHEGKRQLFAYKVVKDQ